MEAIQTVKNQYLGINPHLHSLLQSQGGWDSFHANYLTYTLAELKRQLRPLGYTADLEQSLQIRRRGEIPRFPESDITIYDPRPDRIVQSTASSNSGVKELILPLPQMLGLMPDDMQYYRAIGLYEASQQTAKGEAIVWIELLSPSNKPTGRDFEGYRDKRERVLQSGLVFVEIDYLHEQPPTFAGIANYRAGEPESYPYHITVVDPRPDFFTAEGHTQQFRVDEPIPKADIPLNADDLFTFDFDVPYKTTFESIFYGDQVDYAHFPVGFNLYAEEDQARIATRMVHIITQQRMKKALDSPVEPLPTLDLRTALDRLKVYGVSVD